MLLVHDLVEIDAGDTYCYDDQGREDQAQREKLAADRIFKILPDDQAGAEGQTWQQNDVKSSQVVARMQPVEDGSPFLWNYVKALLDDAVNKGFLAK